MTSDGRRTRRENASVIPLAFGKNVTLLLQLSLLGLVTTTNNVSAGFIDMDTPLEKRTTTSFVDGTVYHLVSSFCFFWRLCKQTNKQAAEPYLLPGVSNRSL